MCKLSSESRFVAILHDSNRCLHLVWRYVHSNDGDCTNIQCRQLMKYIPIVLSDLHSHLSLHIYNVINEMLIQYSFLVILTHIRPLITARLHNIPPFLYTSCSHFTCRIIPSWAPTPAYPSANFRPLAYIPSHLSAFFTIAAT